jgi:pimeloyl-ACP methyl ester carboxylesterase
LGAWISARLVYSYPESVSGLHVNFLPVPRDALAPTSSDPDERRYTEEWIAWLKEEAGYQWIQGTKPQTLAFALTDSPVGLAAWIVEKFRSWSDCSGDVEAVFARDHLLANVSLHWFTGAIGSSFWPYFVRLHGKPPLPVGATIGTPMAYSEFPRELIRPPRSVAERVFTNIQRWTTMERGGHFAAMEQPDALAAEIRAAFRPLRQAS